MWDAAVYLQYAGERARPFADLLSQVYRERAEFIVDLGCGTGSVTQTLAARWPAARVLGVDSSPEMLARAEPLAVPGRLDFVQADIAAWSADRPVDLLVSNAALHWVGDHDGLLARLAGMLAPGGTLAVQMPNRFRTPCQLAIEESSADPRWAATLKGVGLHRESVRPVVWYVERLSDLGFTVNAWETTYIHVLTGADPVLEWVKGTGLRPLLKALEPELADAFQHDLAARLQAVYPARGDVTLFPFPRLFFVATREG
jgi:trans-aconitate 2-methyltransferase